MRTVALVLSSAVVLVALWWGLKPTTSAPSEPQLRQYSLVFSGQQYQGPATLTAYAGDTLRLNVVSDSDDAMHVHGYEKHLVLPAGELTTLEFTADSTGRFMLELHGNDLQFGTLEVYPRQ
ncbi:hypothetical protein [Spongiibacter marinus]|uniref:hypothetical protein n=1 Tax=Spongiibacter marinus TaxID=354246 RepID=UPI00195FFB0A|nr:hypothetical protein [Spongiibacter marinus]MBM7422518.1 hypothetical protein [Spongiibacter marinus]